MDDAGGNANYTIKEMVTEVREDVKRLVSWSERVDSRLESGQKELDDHEERIRRNEMWRLAIPASILTAITGSAAAIVVALINS